MRGFTHQPMKFVSLRQKIIAFGLVATILISALLYLVLNFAIAKGVSKLENDNVERNLQRIENSLDGYFTFLTQKSGDWAKWDASYQFVDDLNEDYVDENLTEDAFSTLGVNIIIYLNSEGEMVYKNGIDPQMVQYEEVPEEILRNTDFIYKKMKQRGEGESLHGYLDIKDHPPLLFVSHHILHSDGSGPVNGVLIMGRYLDDQVLKTLEKSTLFPISFVDTDDSFLSSDFAAAESQLIKGVNNYISRESGDLYGYSMYSDLMGNSFIFRIQMPRELITQYLQAIRYTLLIVFLAGLLLSLITYFALKKIVLNPLGQLHSEVVNMADGRFIKGVKINGNDEIALLSKKINSLLRDLASAEEGMQKKNEELERMNNFMIGREIKMSELKEELQKIKKRKSKS